MGTPQYSVPALEALIASGNEIVAVYSQPPRPAGRGQEMRLSPVHQLAENAGIPVFTPKTLRDEIEQAIFTALDADLAVVIAYGLLLPQAILDAPKFGCINAHASLLPRWRGAAPIQRAIEAGDLRTGVMIMQMEAGLDTGPVLLEKPISIDAQMNTGQLHDQLSELSARLVIDFINLLPDQMPRARAQEIDGVTYAKKIEKSESHISWARSVVDVHNHIRAMSPFPGAWGEFDLGKKPVRVKILAATIISDIANGDHEPGEIINDQLHIAAKDGVIQPTNLQKAGKKQAGREEFLRGNTPIIGSIVS